MSNSTINFILVTRKVNPSGFSPIYLKITMDRKTSYMATGHFIPEKHWNERTQSVRDINQHAKNINNDLLFRKNQVMQKIVELQVAGKTISAKIIKDHFTGTDHTNIFNFIEDYCKEVKHKKDDQTIVVYQRESNTLEKYHGSRNLDFEDITTDYLRDFENYLRGKDYENNYIFGIFKTLKVFFNAARKRGIITNYPFNQYENPVYKQVKKNYLTLQELEKWEEYVVGCTNPVWKQAGLYFLFGCYTGLRVSDWNAFNLNEHVVKGMIKIKPTKKSTGFVNMPISKPLERILSMMNGISLDIEEPTINEKLKYIAEKLEIKKRVTTHSGRHSFAVSVCLENGVSSETTAKLMGITLNTFVRNYSQVTQKKVEEETLNAWSKLL